MDNLSFLWIAIIIIASVIEASTTQLLSIWFVIGATFALITSLFSQKLLIQLMVFIVISVVTLILIRPVLNKALKVKQTHTNADRYIGKTGLVTQDINNALGTGQVNVSGSIWTAISLDGSIIKQGENIVVHSIEGAHLNVKKLND